LAQIIPISHHWFHFAKGNLQPVMGRSMIIGRVGLAPDHPLQMAVQGRLDRVMALVEARLGQAGYLAGNEFTAADIISVFSLTTMRPFQPLDLRGPGRRIGTRTRRTCYGACAAP